MRMYGEVIGSYYLRQNLVRRKLCRDGAEAYFDMIMARMLSETHVGIKVLYNQLTPGFADYNDLDALRLAREALARDTSLHVIHLRRENLLDVVISIELARETRRYIGADYGDAQVRLPVQLCKRQISELEAQEEEFRQLFRHHPYIETTYEDLVEHPEHNLEKICSFIDLPIFPVVTQMRRQRNRSYDCVLENYAELKDALADTRYADFFARDGA